MSPGSYSRPDGRINLLLLDLHRCRVGVSMPLRARRLRLMRPEPELEARHCPTRDNPPADAPRAEPSRAAQERETLLRWSLERVHPDLRSYGWHEFGWAI